jgi:hypothetical protein
MWVCHRCDNPPCCNPAHLFLGTDLDNHADMIAKGRRAVFAGDANPGAKLTPGQVEEIRSATGLQREIAARFGISEASVGLIKRGKRWRRSP